MSALMSWIMEQHTLNESADDIKLGRVTDMTKGHAAIQRDGAGETGWRNGLTGIF